MRTATPLFAKQAAFKYANANARTVVKDFAQHWSSPEKLDSDGSALPVVLV
jgi:hypothetical protein